MKSTVDAFLSFGFLVIMSHGTRFVEDNEVVGLPKVVCDQNAITFNITTKKPLIGHLYVKGWFEKEECRKDFISNTEKTASISVLVSNCGMKKTRQTPSPSYAVIFVVNFHPLFVTKLDRAYKARCFYTQREKSVTARMDINTLATDSVHADSGLLPNCQYTIRANTLSGPVVRYVDVGDIVVHRWECDNPSFGMLVKDCFVSDGAGRSVRILDSKGCPMVTPIIQGNLQYSATISLASVQVWAYKFPDRSDLFFQCQVQLCLKERKECTDITPPRCPNEPFEPEGQLPMTTLATDSVTYVIGTFENFGNGFTEAERPSQSVGTYRRSSKRSIRRLHSSVKRNSSSNVRMNDSDQITIATFMKFQVQNASRDLNVTTGRVYVTDIGDGTSAQAGHAKRKKEGCFICLSRIGYSFLIQAVVGLLLFNLVQLYGMCTLWAKRRRQPKPSSDGMGNSSKEG